MKIIKELKYKGFNFIMKGPALSVEKRDFFQAYNTPVHPSVSTKITSPIGPAVWPAIRNIYI